jgi:tetratricopeptide (TPR) repeat protein
VIEGSLRRLGSGWRVSVQLIEGTTGLTLWSKTFERGPNELLIVQQAIAELVVRTVLPGTEVEIAEPATRDINANELMLLARHYEQQVFDRQEVDLDTQREVVRLYRQATEADPDSALAHSRLAGALIYLGDLEAAEAAISRALLLGPELSEVQNTLGEYHWARGLPGAKAAFSKAIELNRNNTDAIHNYHYAQWLSWDTADHIDELEALLRHALDLDRLSLARHAALGEFLGQEGREDGVRQVIEGIRDLFDSAESYRVIARLKEMIGELDQAIGWALRARDVEPDNPDHVHQLADLYAIIGDFDTAQTLEPAPGLGLLLRMRRYGELIDQAEFSMIEDPSDIGIKYMLAFAYQATGQFESALHILSLTGLPDTALSDQMRSAHEHWAFLTLINVLAAAGTEETLELAHSLAEYNDSSPWHGDIGSIATARSCTLAILGRHDEALKLLPRMNESGRLVSTYWLQDAWCFRQYAEKPEYLEALRDQEDRRARLREILPVTLTEFGVSL